MEVKAFFCGFSLKNHSACHLGRTRTVFLTPCTWCSLLCVPARLLEIAPGHDWRELCVVSSFLALLENSKLCLSALELWLELQVKLQMLELSSNLTIFFPLPNGVSCLHPPLLRVHRAAALRGGSSLFLLQSIPLFIHAALLLFATCERSRPCCTAPFSAGNSSGFCGRQ